MLIRSESAASLSVSRNRRLWLIGVGITVDHLVEMLIEEVVFFIGAADEGLTRLMMEHDACGSFQCRVLARWEAGSCRLGHLRGLVHLLMLR